MRTIEIRIEKMKRKQAWGEHLLELGFERDQLDNKYNKRIVLWSKDGVDYTVRASSDADGNLILTLTEYGS